MARILIVDDLPANRDVLVTLLRYAGHEVLEAANGREALTLASTRRLDLVITDVLMPVMDGYDLVRELRLTPATSAVPVVFSTAHYGEREARDLALASGVSHVLTKPTEPEEVLRVVSRLLGEAPATAATARGALLSADFDREHLRLLTDKLSENVEDLRAANTRLRALINIGLELASERDGDRLLNSVATAAGDLFGATYVTLGVIDRATRTIERVFTHGTAAITALAVGSALPGVLKQVIDTRRSVRRDTPAGDPTALGLPPTHPPVEHVLITPIASPTRMYGWICLVRNGGSAFTNDDDQLLTALSGQAGRIYENGHYHAVARNRAEALEREMLERKQIEAELRRERDNAQRYLDTAGVILLALDVDGRIAQVNRYACDMLGWTSDELVGRDWVDTCLPPRLRGELRGRWSSQLEGAFATTEHAVLTRAGDERLIEWRNTVLRDAAGQVIGTFSSGTDITERDAAIEALRSTEARMRFALEAANIGIWDMDYVTGVLNWSEIAQSQYGLVPGTFPGTFDAFLAGVHPDDREATVQTITRALETGGDFTVQNRSLWPDGTVRWLNGAGRVVRDDTCRPVRAVGITIDVTDRRTLEEQFRQAQKMEAIGRLAGGVAHDFNNLLTVILGYSEMLIQDLGPTHPMLVEMNEIQQAGERATGLTRQLLAFSRQQVIEPAIINLNDTLASLEKLLRRLIREDIQLVIRPGHALGSTLCDRGQMEQVIMNLVVNACDAMPQGGRLVVETANADLDAGYGRSHFGVTAGEYVMLAVSDTGIGMDKATQSRIFEPFFTTKEKGRGTGLGLSTVFGIIDQSGGTIQVYSEPSKGTTFKIYLPKKGDGLAAATDTVLNGNLRGDETVLLVEDEGQIRAVARGILQRQGYRVLEASTAAAASRLAAEYASHIDLLLTDVVMPQTSGRQLAEQLGAERPTMKILFMSGYTDGALEGQLPAGSGFLQKPFTPSSLARKVRELLDGPTSARPAS